MPLTLTEKIATALGSAAIVLVVGAVGLIGTRRANDATLLVSHTRQVAGALQRLTARVTDAETGQRGYLLTHDEQFLGPVAGAEGDATRALLALRQLTSDNLRQQQRLDTLVPLVAERVALLQQTIDRTRAGRSDSTAEHSELRRGEAVMDRLRVLTDSMGAEEQHLLIDRQRRAASERASADVVIIGGTLLAFVLATLGIRFLADAARAEQTAAARLRGQQAELEAQAGELEHRVAEHEVANEELATANEELSERTTEVARASALLDAFLHAAPVGLAFFDLDFRFSRVNQRWAEIGGLSAEAYLGKTLGEVLPSLAVPLLSSLRRALTTGQALTSEVSAPLPDAAGPVRSWRANAYPVDAPFGTMIGAGLVMEEITSRKAYEQERELLLMRAEAARREAETANHAKAEFLAVMSHELRTPLNAISGYVELLELGIRGPVTESQREDLRRIKRSQQHLLGLINDVLNYARLDAGHVHYDIAPVRLTDALAMVEGMIAPQLQSKKLQFVLQPPPDDVCVLADRDKLQQIVLNLLGNAIKFTASGGRITLTAEQRGDRVSINVRDTGIGIPADKLERIFEPFVQVERHLQTSQEGVGLGLSISRDLARAMGGELGVRSELGEGSEFVVELPAAGCS